MIWTVLRVFLGYEWLVAGWEKLTDPTGVWVGEKAGTAISGFFAGAIAKAVGAHPSVATWYGNFLQNFALPNAKFFSYLITFGEIMVGISLILGLFTIIGLLAGGFMNLNYMLAGTTSTNPVLYTYTFILLMVMMVGTGTYVIGLDHFVLPFIKKKFGKKTDQSS